MTPQELRDRTATFAANAALLARPLLDERAAVNAAQQLIRSSASAAANYRAACLARSPAEFRSRLAVTLEEADESLYWLEYLRDARLIAGATLQTLHAEARQLAAIFGAALRTSKLRARARPSK